MKILYGFIGKNKDFKLIKVKKAKEGKDVKRN
jgi:hypothetical protein